MYASNEIGEKKKTNSGTPVYVCFHQYADQKQKNSFIMHDGSCW